jgi:NAD(P)-dependent dehydrogenase (short-subunit alcohol dehydrogenase family)
MAHRMHGRAALVTGAGNGIGKAIAKLLAVEGASVVVNDLGTDQFGNGSNAAPADETVSEILAEGGIAVANYDSVAEPAGCANAVRTTIDAFGACDVVIGNAGAVLATGSLDASDGNWQRLLNLYLGQKIWLTREALPAMLERGWGRIMYATSAIALGRQRNPLGAAVFNGTIGLSRDLANQHRESGVTFNCYAPGAATRLFDVHRSQVNEGLRAGGIDQVNWESYTLPPPECVAPIVVWVCTDAAKGLSGEVFRASGGTIARWSHIQDQGTLFKSGDSGSGVWTLDELDALVPTHLLPGMG